MDRQRNSFERLSEDDISFQSQGLLVDFIFDHMERDGVQDVPDRETFQIPGSPSSRPSEHLHEIGRALKTVASELNLDNDPELEKLANRVPPDAESKTISTVANTLFDDGIFTWGRFAALFNFAYRVCKNVKDSVRLMGNVIYSIVQFIKEKVANMILEIGGWDSIQDYIGSLTIAKFTGQVGFIASAAVFVGFIVYRIWSKAT